MRRVAVSLFLTLTPCLLTAATGYWQHNLVADVAGAADITDPRLVNPWGNVASATSPFWVCDYGTGLSTIYTVNPTNTTPLGTTNTTQPTVPGAGGAGTKGPCTGIVANTANTAATPSFMFSAAGKGPAAASFIFVTEDGVLSAWASGIDATQAFVMQNNSGTAVYKGLALVGSPTVTSAQLYAANFKSGGIDVFDVNFKPVTLAAGAFTDPKIPAGFAPFNIWNIGGKLYVAYAKQDAAKKLDVAGAGNGYVDVFDPTGKLLLSLIAGGTGSALNSPWGMALAPATFGAYANDLIVGNFGDGLMNAFDPGTGKYLGTIQDQNGKNIAISGLWALLFGNGGSGGDVNTLYFTAGPGGQQHGLLGSIQPNPVITSAGITNAGQSAAGIAANTQLTIKGTNLAATKRSAAATDLNGANLPMALDGVSVTINGEPAYLSYISGGQINLLTPSDLPSSGQVSIVVSNNGLTSGTISVPVLPIAPSFFLFTGGYIAAEHANFSLVGPTTLFPNSSTPAAPGETIILYGNGFGATNPPIVNGQTVTGAAPLVNPPAIIFNDIAGKVVFAGQVAAGLYQINVVVPAGLPDGDVPVVAVSAGYSSPPGALITIQN
ncbi:MAG TPA: TIGR03118 family protein [Bryobacteraceae bacterium]|nr:TIGR03118 family protein [Bryobacteraceae bacterium]